MFGQCVFFAELSVGVDLCRIHSITHIDPATEACTLHTASATVASQSLPPSANALELMLPAFVRSTVGRGGAFVVGGGGGGGGDREGLFPLPLPRPAALLTQPYRCTLYAAKIPVKTIDSSYRIPEYPDGQWLLIPTDN